MNVNIEMETGILCGDKKGMLRFIFNFYTPLPTRFERPKSVQQ